TDMGLLQIIAQMCTLADIQNRLLQESNWSPESSLLRFCIWSMDRETETLAEGPRLSSPICFQVPYPLSNSVLKSKAILVLQCSTRELNRSIIVTVG
ncbi:hypothetical protein N328_07326, partial [Gavia stellata]